MTKKLGNLKVATSNSKTRRRLTNTPSRTLAENQVAANSPQPPAGQFYSSEKQALEVLVGGIVGKLADSPKEQLEMAEFLDMVLETDPELKREILAATTIRENK
jgi:hypothetical protein